MQLMHTIITRTALLCTVSLLPFHLSYAATGQQNWSGSVAYQQTSGDYGLGADTEIISTTLGFQYGYQQWRAAVSLPLLQLTGDSSVTLSSGGVIRDNDVGQLFNGPGQFNQTSTSTQNQVSGLGDITTSVAYLITPADSNWYYELSSWIKWGTASASKQLGTGENDLSVGAYISYEKHALMPFISTGYTWLGDTSTLDFNNTALASVGVLYMSSSNSQFSLSFNYQQASLDTADDMRQWNMAFMHMISPQWSVNLSALIGMSNTVADSGVGFSLVRSF